MTAAQSITMSYDIILITGNMASGKSSVAQALAERLTRSVHLRGDVFRQMIVHGQAEMTVELSGEAKEQLQLRYDLAVASAKRYVDAGFTVIYQDIIIGSWLREVVAAFHPYRLAVVVLCPRVGVLAEREKARHKTGYPDRASIDEFDHILRAETPRIGHWLDNSDLNLEATVDKLALHLRESGTRLNPGNLKG